jgi:hypothetical protein
LRSLGSYFLLEQITGETTRNEILQVSNDFIDKFECFDISMLYSLFEKRTDIKHIKNCSTFADFYRHIANDKIQFFKISNNGFVVMNKSMTEIIKTLSTEITSTIASKNYGDNVPDYDLQEIYNCFSTATLFTIIKKYINDKIIYIDIDGTTYYRTLESLNLPDDFSITLLSIFTKIIELNLDPSDEIIHALLSVNLEYNFKEQYNIDKHAFRQIISIYYDDPSRKREWKGGNFSEVSA